MSTPDTQPSLRPAVSWSFVAALLFAAFNLRAPFVAVAPISSQIQQGFGVGAGEVGLLTTVPVLAFGLAAPLALLVARRLGPEIGFALCLAAIVVGGLLRSAGPFGLAVVATVIIGLGITIGNIVGPVLVRRDVPPERAGLVTGLYTSIFNIGSMLATLLTAPLAAVVGWRPALGAAVVIAFPALLVWVLYLVRRQARSAAVVPAPPTVSIPVWRNPTAWLLAVAFAAQAGSYYGLTAWLPTLLSDQLGFVPSEAGAAAAAFQIFAVVGALALPLLSYRLPTWLLTLGVGVLWLACPVLLLLLPGSFLLACVLGGIAQGGGITAIFTAVVKASHSDRESAQLSAFVQGTGYVVCAALPSVIGFAHDATGTWRVPLLLLVATTLVFTLTATASALRSRRTPAT